MWAWFDGRLVPFAEARVPLEDRGLQFGESVYEVVGMVAGSPFVLEAHVERMRRGASELGLSEGVPPLETWREIARQLDAREHHRAGLLYAQLTGGVAARRHVPVKTPHPVFFAYLRPHDFPGPGETARGMSIITLPDTRWYRSDVKTSMLLPAVMAKREAAARGADEAVFVGQDGYVADGASSTVFVVRQRGVLTAPTSRRALPGTSALVVRRICTDLGIPITDHHLTLSDLTAADELFVASTTLLLMPVVEVDGKPVASGSAGPVSLQLAYHFQRLFWGAAEA
jgi:D-alanine transaminase